MKVCNRCKISKEISEFGNLKSGIDGLSPRCRLCMKEIDYNRRTRLDIVETIFKSHANEKWIDIDTNYKISNYGRIFSDKIHNGIKGKYLKFIPDKHGYLKVSLKQKGETNQYFIHRLVALSFIENSQKLPMVNHIDSDKFNNHVDNLEWVDNRENVTHGLLRKNKSSKYTGVSWCCSKNRWISQLRVNKKSIYIGSYIDEKEAGLAYQNGLMKRGFKNKYMLI
jgi:hemerythrin-like domain-containing protein